MQSVVSKGSSAGGAGDTTTSGPPREPDTITESASATASKVVADEQAAQEDDAPPSTQRDGGDTASSTIGPQGEPCHDSAMAVSTAANVVGESISAVGPQPEPRPNTSNPVVESTITRSSSVQQTDGPHREPDDHTFTNAAESTHPEPGRTTETPEQESVDHLAQGRDVTGTTSHSDGRQSPEGDTMDVDTGPEPGKCDLRSQTSACGITGCITATDPNAMDLDTTDDLDADGDEDHPDDIVLDIENGSTQRSAQVRFVSCHALSDGCH